MPPSPPLPSPQTLRRLLEREQDDAFLDLLLSALEGSLVSKRNILSGWRVYLKWVREERRSVLNADAEQAAAYAQWLSTTYEAPATLNNRLTQVRKLYRLLAAVELYHGDAFERTHGQVNPADERRPIYTAQEIERLLAHGNLQEQLLVRLGAELGLTGPEVLQLTFEDFKESSQELSVPGRKAPLTCSGELKAALEKLRLRRGERPLYGEKASGKLFDLDGAPALRAVLFRLCHKANVPYRAWMALRNQAAVKMFTATGDNRLTAAKLGVQGRQALNPTIRLVKGRQRRRK